MKLPKIVIAIGVVTTVAGGGGVNGSTFGSADGTGGATGTARFSSPAGITTDGISLFVIGNFNNKIRKIK